MSSTPTPTVITIRKATAKHAAPRGRWIGVDQNNNQVGPSCWENPRGPEATLIRDYPLAEIRRPVQGGYAIIN